MEGNGHRGRGRLDGVFVWCVVLFRRSSKTFGMGFRALRPVRREGCCSDQTPRPLLPPNPRPDHSVQCDVAVAVDRIRASMQSSVIFVAMLWYRVGRQAQDEAYVVFSSQSARVAKVTNHAPASTIPHISTRSQTLTQPPTFHPLTQHIKLEYDIHMALAPRPSTRTRRARRPAKPRRPRLRSCTTCRLSARTSIPTLKHLLTGTSAREAQQQQDDVVQRTSPPAADS